jgi:CRISPR-associated endonuclease Cas3-HD
MFFAHSTDRTDRSDWQKLPEHLLAVASLAAKRGQKFGAQRAAALAGILHDLGKYSTAFQRRLDGSRERLIIRRPERRTWGSWRLAALIAAWRSLSPMRLLAITWGFLIARAKPVR